jgi:hypothetical protein
VNTKRFSRRALSRRALLAVGGRLGALSVFGASCADRSESDDDEEPSELWLSAHGADEASFGLVIAGPSGVAATIPSGFRGHDVTARPQHPTRVMMFGRRPGHEAIEVDLEERRIVRRLALPEGRALQGHGCFTADGVHLVTSEVDVESGRGVLAVRVADSFELVAELDSHGIGPHEIAWMPDGRTLAVANGGLLTKGEEPVNLDTMRSSLSYVDVSSGELVDEVLFVEPKASIRHLDVCEDGTVVVAMQVQREAMQSTEVVPLVAVHRPGEALVGLSDGIDAIAAMDDYAGSVAVVLEASTQVVGATSPRGNLALFWDVRSGALLGQLELFDVCGIAVSMDADRFIVTGGDAQVRELGVESLALLSRRVGPFPGVRWDNHLFVHSLRSSS